MNIKQNISKTAELSIATTLVATIVLTACGGGGGGGGGSTSSNLTSVTASPSLGQFAKGAKVIVRDKNGKKIGEGEIGDDGTTSIAINNNEAGPFLFEAGFDGDRYFDEKQGQQVAIKGTGGNASLRSLLPKLTDAASGIGITPLTEIAAQSLLNASGIPKVGITAASAVGANKAVENIFGINPIKPPKLIDSTEKIKNLGTSDDDQYALKLAALAHMANDGEQAHDVAKRLRTEFQKTSSGVPATVLGDMKKGLAKIPSLPPATLKKLNDDIDKELDDQKNNPIILIQEIEKEAENEHSREVYERTTSGVTRAKALVSSLRDNLTVLHTKDKKGFLDTQFKQINDELDLQNILSQSGAGPVGMLEVGAKMLLNNLPTGSVRTMYNYFPCVVTSAGVEVVCQFNTISPMSPGNYALHQLVINATSSTAVTWSESLLGQIQNYTSSVGITSPNIANRNMMTGQWTANLAAVRTPLVSPAAKTGSVAVAFSNGHITSLTAKGDFLPAVPAIANFERNSIDINATISGSGAQQTFALNGNASTINSANQTVNSTTIKPGSNIIFTGTTNDPELISVKLSVEEKSPNYAFNGDLNVSDMANNLAGDRYPQKVSFIGTVKNLADPAVGEFLKGTFEAAWDESKFNPKAKKSEGNTEKGKLTFTGTITASPTAVYKAEFIAEQISPVITKLSFTYTDRSGNVVTLEGMEGNKKPTKLKMGNIVFENDKVKEGDVVIGTFDDQKVYFNNGEFLSF